MESFIGAVNTAVATSTQIIGNVGYTGVKILLATLAVAIVVIFVRIGFKHGINAMQGKIPQRNIGGESIGKIESGTFEEGIFEIRGKRYKSKKGSSELESL